MNKKNIRVHIPNAITITRLVLALFLGILLFIPQSLSVAQIVLVIAVISDKLDGTVARLWKVESELGKKLESLVDPVLGCCAATYITLRLDFPIALFITGLVIFSIGVVGRIVFTKKTGKLFYQKSPLTRYGTALLYIVLMLYFFQVSYRHIILGPFLGYTLIGFVNYLRLIRNALRLQKQQL